MDPRLFITDPAILSAGFPHSSGNCVEIQQAVHVWGLVPQVRDFRTLNFEADIRAEVTVALSPHSLEGKRACALGYKQALCSWGENKGVQVPCPLECQHWSPGWECCHSLQPLHLLMLIAIQTPFTGVVATLLRKFWLCGNVKIVIAFQQLWAVVLEKTLESHLDCKETQPVHPKGNQSWIFIERIDAEAEAPILWPPDAKNWLTRKDPDTGKDWRQEEKGATEDVIVGWHHWLNGDAFE